VGDSGFQSIIVILMEVNPESMGHMDIIKLGGGLKDRYRLF